MLGGVVVTVLWTQLANHIKRLYKIKWKRLHKGVNCISCRGRFCLRDACVYLCVSLQKNLIVHYSRIEIKNIQKLVYRWNERELRQRVHVWPCVLLYASCFSSCLPTPLLQTLIYRVTSFRICFIILHVSIIARLELTITVQRSTVLYTRFTLHLSGKALLFATTSLWSFCMFYTILAHTCTTFRRARTHIKSIWSLCNVVLLRVHHPSKMEEEKEFKGHCLKDSGSSREHGTRW